MRAMCFNRLFRTTKTQKNLFDLIEINKNNNKTLSFYSFSFKFFKFYLFALYYVSRWVCLFVTMCQIKIFSKELKKKTNKLF